MPVENSRLKAMKLGELNALSDSIHSEIIDVIRKNGGHLSSNLGVVDLTVALHYVFDFSVDKLVFDVGHQCYAHKILTRDGFDTIRKKGGLSGFPKTSESVYDCFDTGHSGTSMSVACGFAAARELSRGNYNIVVLVGDGSVSNGMWLEALNDCAADKRKYIVVLNDNGMTIAPTVGKIGEIFKSEKESERFFNMFGFDYSGFVDGHDMSALIDALTAAEKSEKSIVVHVKTVKGKGFSETSAQAEKFHSCANCPSGETFGRRLSATLIKLAERNDKIVAVTAAMTDGVGLSEFRNRFPERFFDVGIAEEHAVTMCAALAKAGYKPYFAVYSTFLQRGFDQIVHDVTIQKLPVTFCVDHSGIVSGDGETHQGVNNISYLRAAGVTVASPKNLDEFEEMLKWSENYDAPLAVRYGKGSADNSLPVEKIEEGKWSVDKNIGKFNIVYIGAKMCAIARKLCDKLGEYGVDCGMVNARFANPLDYEKLDILADGKTAVLEDNVSAGGLSSAVFEYYGAAGKHARVLPFALTERRIPNMTDDEAFDEFGFRFDDILSKCLDFFR